MSLRTDLVTLLLEDTTIAALVGTKVYMARVPEGVAMPAITLHLTSTERDLSCDGPLGRSRSILACNCMATSYDAMEALALAVRNKLHGQPWRVGTFGYGAYGEGAYGGDLYGCGAYGIGEYGGSPAVTSNIEYLAVSGDADAESIGVDTEGLTVFNRQLDLTVVFAES